MYLGNLVGEGGVFAMIVNILTVSIILVRMLIHYREVETLVDFFFWSLETFKSWLLFSFPLEVETATATTAAAASWVSVFYSQLRTFDTCALV